MENPTKVPNIPYDNIAKVVKSHLYFIETKETKEYNGNVAMMDNIVFEAKRTLFNSMNYNVDGIDFNSIIEKSKIILSRIEIPDTTEEMINELLFNECERILRISIYNTLPVHGIDFIKMKKLAEDYIRSLPPLDDHYNSDEYSDAIENLNKHDKTSLNDKSLGIQDQIAAVAQMTNLINKYVDKTSLNDTSLGIQDQIAAVAQMTNLINKYVDKTSLNDKSLGIQDQMTNLINKYVNGDSNSTGLYHDTFKEGKENVADNTSDNDSRYSGIIDTSKNTTLSSSSLSGTTRTLDAVQSMLWTYLEVYCTMP